MLAIAHDRAVRLLDYTGAKTVRLDRSVLVIEEERSRRYGGGDPSRRIEISPEGEVVVEIVVTGASEHDDDLGGLGNTFFLLRTDVVDAITSAFRFAGALFEKVDCPKRHLRFFYGVTFNGLGFRSLVDRVERKSSYSMGRDIRKPVVVESGRQITRETLRQPAAEASRVMTLLEREIDAR